MFNTELVRKTEPEERHVCLSERNPLSPGKKGHLQRVQRARIVSILLGYGDAI